MGCVARSINTRFAVAVHVLTYLAGVTDGRPVSSDEMATSVNANPVYLRRVLGPLREAGLVRAQRGLHGGWELRLAADQISLDVVWRLLQGDDPVLGLHGPDPACATGRRVQDGLVALDHLVAGSVEAALGGVTIRDVAAGTVVPAHA